MSHPQHPSTVAANCSRWPKFQCTSKFSFTIFPLLPSRQFVYPSVIPSRNIYFTVHTRWSAIQSEVQTIFCCLVECAQWYSHQFIFKYWLWCSSCGWLWFSFDRWNIGDSSGRCMRYQMKNNRKLVRRSQNFIISIGLIISMLGAAEIDGHRFKGQYIWFSPFKHKLPPLNRSVST